MSVFKEKKKSNNHDTLSRGDRTLPRCGIGQVRNITIFK